jgi:hypothetical protein
MTSDFNIRYANTVASIRKAPDTARRLAEIIVAEAVIKEHPCRALDGLAFKIVTPLSKEFIDQLAEHDTVKRDKMIECVSQVEAFIHGRLRCGELRHLSQADAFARLDSGSVAEIGTGICQIIEANKLAETQLLKEDTVLDIQLFLEVEHSLQRKGFQEPLL